MQGRAEGRPVALSEATGDAVRRKSSAAAGEVSGEPRRGWSVPRRSGPGTRRRDSLSVETQAAAAEAAAAAARAAAAVEAEAAEAAAAEAAAAEAETAPEEIRNTLVAAAGRQVGALPTPTFGGRDTLPGPVAAQIQMHGLMLMKHWSSLTSMDSVRVGLGLGLGSGCQGQGQGQG